MAEVEIPITDIADPFPKNILFSITNRCNFLCSFCGQNKNKWTKEEELTFDDYRNLLDEVADISGEKVKEHKKALKQIFVDFDYCYLDKFINISPPFDIRKLLKNIDKAKKKAHQKKLRTFFSYNFKDGEIEQWYNSDEAILHKCAFLKNFLILPNGDLPLCDFIRYPVGNVRERSMEELWKVDKGQQFRKMIRKKLLPGCERCCQLM